MKKNSPIWQEAIGAIGVFIGLVSPSGVKDKIPERKEAMKNKKQLRIQKKANNRQSQ